MSWVVNVFFIMVLIVPLAIVLVSPFILIPTMFLFLFVWVFFFDIKVDKSLPLCLSLARSPLFSTLPSFRPSICISIISTSLDLFNFLLK